MGELLERLAASDTAFGTAVRHHGQMEELARSSLRWEAGFSAIMGVATAIWFIQIAEVLDAPRALVGATGLLSILWAGFLVILSRIPSWRAAATLAVSVKLIAAMGWVATIVFIHSTQERSVLLGGITIQLLGLAAVQTRALRSRETR